MSKARRDNMTSLLRNRYALPIPDPVVNSDAGRWKRDKIESLFMSKADAYDGALDRAILVIEHHANEKGPPEVIEIIKSLKTNAAASEA